MEGKAGDLEGLAEVSGKTIAKESAIPTSDVLSANKTSEAAVPDPDEDDLDDLDDMLDEFTPTKPEPAAPTSTSKSTANALPTDSFNADGEGVSDEDFAKQLQQGMAELLGGLDNDPEMASQFEAMMKELTAEASMSAQIPEVQAKVDEPTTSKQVPSTSTKKKATKAKKEENPAEDFQETIRKTMERLNASGSSASAAAASSANEEEDLMAEMLKAMQASGLGGENGAGGEEDFSKMLLGMMEQLTNKEILYEPMKELDDKFPEWMTKNEGKVGSEDMKRYKEQQVYVREIVARFEAKGYSDDNVQDREYIVERMQKMQAAGSPPADLVGDMAAAQEAFGAPEEGCPQQ